MTMISEGEWEKRLSQNRNARIWWYNLQFDKVWSNVPPEVIDEFESRLNSMITKYPPDTDPLAIIKNIINSDPFPFDMKADRAPATTDRYSRIVEVETFATHYISPKWPAGKGLEEGPLEEWEDAEGGEEGSIEERADMVWQDFTKIKPEHYGDKEMRGLRNFFWVTKTESIEGMQELCDHDDEVLDCEHRSLTATRTRNRLGLYRVEARKRLVRIDIPEEVIARATVCAPTTLDADPENPAFAPSNDRDNNVGWALDLEGVAASRQYTCGVEELVVKPIPFTKELTAKRIGVVGDSLPDIDSDVFEEIAIRRASEK